MERVIRERAELREKAVKEALEFSRCASEKLGRLTATLFGSYARVISTSGATSTFS